MSKRNKKKSQKQIVQYVYNNMSQDRIIQIQAEAYYKALKRLEQEKVDLNESVTEKKKEKWYTRTFFVFNVLFFPWKISKRFTINKGIYDSILVLFVSGVLEIAGVLIWLIGIYLILSEIYKITQVGISDTFFSGSFIGILAIFLGSLFVLASDAFSKEVDSSKIYAYSACIIALVSCVVSIFTLLQV